MNNGNNDFLNLNWSDIVHITSSATIYMRCIESVNRTLTIPPYRHTGSILVNERLEFKCGNLKVRVPRIIADVSFRLMLIPNTTVCKLTKVYDVRLLTWYTSNLAPSMLVERMTPQLFHAS